MVQFAIMSSQELWTTVDEYLIQQLNLADDALDAALRKCEAAGLPAIGVSACQGKLLQLLVRMQGAQRVLEIGTLGGYSTIWMGRALPTDGRLITLEHNPDHASVAEANLTRAGLSEIVNVLVGPALATLPTLVDHEPFDFVFIDADKVNTAAYFDWAVKLSRAGSVIVVDNVVRKGAVIDADSDDENVQGMRRFLDGVSSDSRVAASCIQTVGTKGHDGFMIARVRQRG